MTNNTSILMVVTNQDKIDAERPTGLWLEEFTIAYQRFLEAGYTISVASPRGQLLPSIRSVVMMSMSRRTRRPLRG